MRIAVYNRGFGAWSVSPHYAGNVGESLFMDIDSAATTPILKDTGNPADAEYLRHELTAVGYHLVERPEGFTALVIGPGGGRDLATTLKFGARHMDGVEINPIIARDVMLDRFREYSGGVYVHPSVTTHIDDGRSFVRRSTARYDVIQASLVDTWAATAAGAYTLTENSLYTSEAFGDYLEHLTDEGLLTITRWTFDGIRLVSLAQEACAARGLHTSQHLAIVRNDTVVTVLLKRTPFTPEESERLRRLTDDLGFAVLYAPGVPQRGGPWGEPVEMHRTGTGTEDYRRLILAPDRAQFFSAYPLDITPTTDDRPFYFHTTRLRDQFDVAFGRSMLFGNGLSALLTLMAISAALVLLFIVGPLLVGRGRPARGWGAWLVYFGALGAGFMLLEVALLQRFVLLLGTGLGSLVSRRVAPERVKAVTVKALVAVFALALLSTVVLPLVIDFAIAWPLPLRILTAGAILVPLGVLLGISLPGGMRLVAVRWPDIVPWGWGMNGALSVVGATLAVFVAMNWGFTVTLSLAALVYAGAAQTLRTRNA